MSDILKKCHFNYHYAPNSCKTINLKRLKKLNCKIRKILPLEEIEVLSGKSKDLNRKCFNEHMKLKHKKRTESIVRNSKRKYQLKVPEMFKKFYLVEILSLIMFVSFIFVLANCVSS